MLKNIKILRPLSYFEMQKVIMEASLLITDSGGMQKEAFFLNTPCLTTRNETEWVETVKHGYNKLVGPNTNKILEAFSEDRKFKDTNKNIYGDGHSAKYILNDIINYFK